MLERRYRVDSVIARGGMSVVYRGLDTRLDRPVALKVMNRAGAAAILAAERWRPTMSG